MTNSLHALFLDSLAKTYDAEQQLLKALPKMALACNCEELRTSFEDHLDETTAHVLRLEQVAELLGERLMGKPCLAMQGLVEEGNEAIRKWQGTEALDAALIFAAQKIEHFEIAAYGELCTWADGMGNLEVSGLLRATLVEEKHADRKLTAVAELANEVEEDWAD